MNQPIPISRRLLQCAILGVDLTIGAPAPAIDFGGNGGGTTTAACVPGSGRPHDLHRGPANWMSPHWGHLADVLMPAPPVTARDRTWSHFALSCLQTPEVTARPAPPFPKGLDVFLDQPSGELPPLRTESLKVLLHLREVREKFEHLGPGCPGFCILGQVNVHVA